MADLQVLRKRLASIESTGSMCQAMKTVASAKYSKLSRQVKQLSEYSEGCREVLRLIPGSALKREAEPGERAEDLYLVLSGDKGFCGGFNSELIKFALRELPEEKRLIAVCGKKGQKLLSDRGIEFTPLDLPDSPAHTDAQRLFDFLKDAYVTGRADKVYIIYQKFNNMLSQVPTKLQLLPFSGGDTGDEASMLFLPSREAFGAECAEECLVSELYGIILSHCCAAQAATVMSMKSACDNAKKSADALLLQINRMRQAQVTNSVIETSAGMAAQYSEM